MSAVVVPAEPDQSGAHDVLKALEAFVVNNPDLERLEALGSRFNISRRWALCARSYGTRTSSPFCWIHDRVMGLEICLPSGSCSVHCQVAGTGTFDLTPIHVDLMVLNGMSVRREWRNIDLLLLDETNRLAVIIENKVDSTEHSSQLDK